MKGAAQSGNNDHNSHAGRGRIWRRVVPHSSLGLFVHLACPLESGNYHDSLALCAPEADAAQCLPFVDFSARTRGLTASSADIVDRIMTAPTKAVPHRKPCN